MASTTAEWRRARYAYLKTIHLCTRCSMKDEYTISGKTYCKKCAAYYRDRWRREHKKGQKKMVKKLIEEYEAKAATIRDDMPEHEKMGSGQYYRHKLAMIEEFIRKLREVIGNDNMDEGHAR